MLKSIPILEKFAVSSMIMPYFAPPHLSFLLLSKLSSRSRAMLDEFYEEILNWMLNTAILISISEDNEKAVLLPCDLFKFSFYLKNERITELFLQLIKNINQSKGYYFNSHFMHSRLWIASLNVDSNLIAKLYSSLDLLKETKIINYTGRDDKVFSYQRTELIDKFSLILSFSGASNKAFYPHFDNKSEDDTKLKPEFELFKRISYVDLSSMSFYLIIDMLEWIKKLQLKLDWLSVWSKSSEESEIVSSPEYYK